MIRAVWAVLAVLALAPSATALPLRTRLKTPLFLLPQVIPGSPFGGGSGGGSFSGGTISSATNVVDDVCFTLGSTDTSASPCLRYDTTQTVDTGMLLTGTVSNHWVIAERQDETFDFAHAQATNPTLFIHSAAQSTTQWVSLTHDGTDGVLDVGAGILKVPDGITSNGTNRFTSATVVTAGQAAIQMSQAALNCISFGTNGTPADNSICSAPANTPDTGYLGTGTTSNAWVLAETQDETFDFAHAAATNPTLFIHSRTQSTTEFVGIAHNVGGAVINNQGSVTLTEAGGAETVLTVTTATTQMTGGRLIYTVKAADSAGSPDYVVRAGSLNFGMTNSAGTTTCTSAISAETGDGSVATTGGTAKTLTYAITYVTAANTCAIKFNIDSDIVTVTSASITYTLILDGPGVVS